VSLSRKEEEEWNRGGKIKKREKTIYV